MIFRVGLSDVYRLTIKSYSSEYILIRIRHSSLYRSDGWTKSEASQVGMKIKGDKIKLGDDYV